MKQGWGPIRPEWLFFVFWCAGVLLPIWPFIAEVDGFSIFWGYEFSDKLTSLITALVIYTLVLLLFILGVKIGAYSLRKYPAAPTLTDDKKQNSFVWRAAVVTIIASIALAVLCIVMGGVTELVFAGGDRIRKFAGLNFLVLLQNGLLSVSLAWLIKLSRFGHLLRLCSHKGFILYSVLAFFIVALQGAKSTLFVYLLAMLVIWHVRIRRFRVAELAIIGALLFVFLMIYHVIKQEYLVVGEFVFYDDQLGLWESLGNMLFVQLTGNLMQLQCLTVLVDAMPDYLPYQWGETLKMVFQIWLPSIFFPDKPLTAPGVFTLALWPNKWEVEATTLPPGLFGEFYMNFGWIGALLGALLFGIVYGIFYRRAVGNPDSDQALGIYALFAGCMLHYFRGEAASVTVLLGSILVPLIWLLKKPSHKMMVPAFATNELRKT